MGYLQSKPARPPPAPLPPPPATRPTGLADESSGPVSYIIYPENEEPAAIFWCAWVTQPT